jgi:hypothetical protein
MPDAKATMKALIAAFEAKSADAVMDLISPDVRIEAGLTRVPPSDLESLRGQIAEVLGSYDWLRLEPRILIAEGNAVAALLNIRARFNKDLLLFGARLPTAGHTVNYESAMFAEVNDAGQITRFIRVR